MNLDTLRALVDVIEHGSFQAAAQAARVPRTKLRRQVERLEKEVGARLLDRSVTGVRPTPAGERVIRRAGPLLADAARLVLDAQAANGAVVGTLRLIVPVGTPIAPRARAVRALQELHPGVVLDVMEADDPLTELHRPFDVLLHLGQSPDRAGWFSRVLLRLPVRAAASPSYLAEHGTPATPEDLADHRLLAWRAGGRFAESWPLRDGTSWPVAPAFLCANPQLVTQLAAAGGGIALAPAAGTILGLDAGGLVPVLEEQVGTEVEVRGLTPVPSRTDPRLRALFENLDRLLTGLAPS